MSSKERKNNINTPLSVKYTTSILELIFQYLTEKEIIRISTCCKAWNTIIRTSSLAWKYVTLKIVLDSELWESYFILLDRYKPYFSCISSLDLVVNHIYSYKSYQLEQLLKYFGNNSKIEQIEFTFNPKISKKDICRFLSYFTFPNLKKWTLNCNYRAQKEYFNLGKLFCHSTHLESISLKQGYSGSSMIINHLNGLKKFSESLTEVYLDYIYFKKISSLKIINRLQNLRKLTLTNNYFENLSNITESKQTNLVEILNSHSHLFSFYKLTSLKELKLRGIEMVYLLPFFISSSLEQREESRMKLDKLTLIHHTYSVKDAYYDFYLDLLNQHKEFHFISELILEFPSKRMVNNNIFSNFQNLKVCNLRFPSFSFCRRGLISLLAEKNSSSLEQLVINSTQDCSWMEMENIKKFSKLSYLNLANTVMLVQEFLEIINWSSLNEIYMEKIKLMDNFEGMTFSPTPLIWENLKKFPIEYTSHNYDGSKTINYCYKKREI